ncbi:hypothetical protein H8356DRAFT_1352237 [Neocallimastix lanati (nom. inval.)]|nr:hypothetical protein H8356DRAFT_1352237 [Neocallimastix sp. JGI-2020a]
MAEIVKLLIGYSNKNYIVLEINKQDEILKLLFTSLGEIAYYYSLLWAIEKNSFELNYNDNYLLLYAVGEIDIEMVKLISEYAKRNNVVLVMNDKDKWGRNPLLYGIEKNNIEIVKLLINYAIKYKIILKINEQNKWGNYSLLESTYNNNIEIIKLLNDYINKYHIA